MKYRVIHRSTYTYEQAVTACHNEARLIPRIKPHQRRLAYRLEIDPPPASRREREDFFGNHVVYYAIDIPHDRLVVTASSDIELVNPGDQLPLRSDVPWQASVRRLHEELNADNLDARQYLLDSPMVSVTPEIKRYATPAFRDQRPVADVVHDIMARIHRDFTYDPEFTTIATPLSEVLKHRRGVCQDFAHLAIACLRSHGLPARYVSGYIETQAPPGQEKLQGADASHAWFAVYDPNAGWLDYDPTNNQIPIDRHITTAWGRDYADITPLKGVIYGGGSHHDTAVAVDVVALADKTG
jgi:transglutaminase-like putative cysteine protease